MYAELLPNIRQITVTVGLPSSSNSSTSAKLSSDGHQFTLQHDEETSILTLPGQVVPDAPIQKPIFGLKELSWRLPLAGQSTRGDVESNEAPWPAMRLGEGAEFLCRSCGSVIVQKGTIKFWKDLPSENWAEMMDFWHCHKPDHEPNGTNGCSHNSHLAATKGYGANTTFTAQPATAFVDLTTFLLTQSDCIGINVSHISLSISHQNTPDSGIKKVAIPALASRWLGHRYKYPRSKPVFPTCFGGCRSCLPSSSDYGLLGWLEDLPRHLLRIFLRCWKAMGIHTGDIYIAQIISMILRTLPRHVLYCPYLSTLYHHF